MLQDFSPLDSRQNDAPMFPELKLRSAGDCARFVLRIDPGNLALAAEAFGAAIPAMIGTMETAKERRAICLGPDEWLLHAPLDEAVEITSRFEALYADCPHNLADIGSREVGILVEGSDAAVAINAACPRNLDDLASGAAMRTVFGGVTVILIRQSHTDYRIEVWRSFAAHVWDLLVASSIESALKI